MLKNPNRLISILLLAAVALWNAWIFVDFALFSFVPMVLFGILVIDVSKRISEKTLLAALLLFAILLQIRNQILFEPNVLVDSQWFLMWGRTFAEGHGFPGMWYRPPLYPFLLGLNFLVTHSIAPIIILQRLMMVAAVPMVFDLSKKWGFDTPVAAGASLLFAMNSLTMQMSRSVLVESLFIFLFLCTLLVFTKFMMTPSWQGAVASGMLFAVTAHCRQIASPLLFVGLAVFFVNHGKKKIPLILLTSAVFLACCAPWSVRNYRLYGRYALSYNLGPTIFTKLTSFKLQDDSGEHFIRNKVILDNVERALGIAGYAVPEHPEDNWTVNRIPHVMMDSLVKNHGYSYGRATQLLTAVSVEGFLRHPVRYGKSVANTLYALLFAHHETPPSIADIFPFSQKLPYWLRAPLRSFVAIHALFFLLFAWYLLWRKESLFSVRWAPLALLFYGYLSVAMIQVGFSRYTVPWMPFAAMCAAYTGIHSAQYVIEKLAYFRKKRRNCTLS